jgi:hypothetical protein
LILFSGGIYSQAAEFKKKSKEMPKIEEYHLSKNCQF